jgi:4-diphosphocytidyl-2-C-methyl-D-erythritol kinase
LRLIPAIQAKRSDQDLRTVLKEPVASWRDQIKNDFEATLFVKYPLLETIKKDLYQLGADIRFDEWLGINDIRDF